MSFVGPEFTLDFRLQGEQMNKYLRALIGQVRYWSSKHFYTRAMSVTIRQPRRVRGLICQGPWVSAGHMQHCTALLAHKATRCKL